MNLDKKLAKYARHLDNPKYYDKITKILMKADKSGYQFKSFNDFDMIKISGELAAYYDAITTDEEHKRMVRYYNKHWFIISDKNYILFDTPYLWNAISFYIRCYYILLLTKLRQLIILDRLITADNVHKDVYLLRGAIKAANWLNCESFELDKKYIEQ